jgi:hypothetical protein
MTHKKLKQYLTKVIEQNPNAIATYEIDGESFPIHEVFGLDREDVDYYELYSDIGFEGQESDNTPLTAQDIYDTIYSFPIENGQEQNPEDTRIDIIVGNEDGNDIHTGEIQDRNLIFTDVNGQYIPHKRDVEATALGLYDDNLTISTEEERGETIDDIIAETISDMQMDFSENSGDDLTVKEQEIMQMFDYTEAELEAAKKMLEDKYLIKNNNKGKEIFLKSSFNGFPKVEQIYGKLLDLDKIEEIKTSGEDISNEDIIAYNRTVSTTNNIYLLSKLFPDFEFKNEYDKNKTQFDFNYTLTYFEKSIEIQFDSKKGKFVVSSEDFTNNEETHFAKKLTDGLHNLNTFIDSLSTYQGVELKINIPTDPKHNPAIKEEWQPVRSDVNDDFLYNEENVFGKIISNDLFMNQDHYSLYTVVNFGDSDDLDYEVYFGNVKSPGINNIEDLDIFMKVNTFLNKFEASYNKPFNQLLNDAAGIQQIKIVIRDFISFTNEHNVKITKEDLITYANIEVAHMPKHGFQNLILNSFSNGKKDKGNNQDI